MKSKETGYGIRARIDTHRNHAPFVGTLTVHTWCGMFLRRCVFALGRIASTYERAEFNPPFAATVPLRLRARLICEFRCVLLDATALMRSTYFR